MNRNLIIAIDGNAGSGKSTLAQSLAKNLKYRYIDTGAMYRLLTFHVLKRGIKDNKRIIDLAKNIKISLKDLKTKRIRFPEVSDLVSKVSAIKGVRYWMVKHQRRLAKGGGVIVEGRDIGTVVFPKADIKFFLTADVSERTKRRYKELQQKGIKVAKKSVQKNIVSRDAKDSSRKVSPLKPAKDAIIMDTTHFTITKKNKIALNLVRQYEKGSL